jgi:branched-subunit amino acid ABC-type transport system permease component
MVSALGVDIKRLFMIVFGFGAMLAGFAGSMVAWHRSSLLSRAWATRS